MSRDQTEFRDPHLVHPLRCKAIGLDLLAASREIVADCLAVIDGELRLHAKADPRVKVLTTLPGVGQFTALIMLAEIGDIGRFGAAPASWPAGPG